MKYLQRALWNWNTLGWSILVPAVSKVLKCFAIKIGNVVTVHFHLTETKFSMAFNQYM